MVVVDVVVDVVSVPVVVVEVVSAAQVSYDSSFGRLLLADQVQITYCQWLWSKWSPCQLSL